MASASKHMVLTQQQLRRLLKKNGTCFQCVLDETRKANAAHYLFETDIRFSEITYLLGFSDQSTFSRAVRRWFGSAPRDARSKCRQDNEKNQI
jgi:AraC-like DNA-binding protein